MKRPAYHALQVLTGLMLVSGVVRFGVVATSAVAAEGNLPEMGLPASATDGCAPASDAVLAALRAREDRLVQREGAMADRMRALEVVEARVQNQLVALDRAQSDLAATMAQASTAASNDLATLTAVYQEMKPEEAAAIFTAMDPVFAAGFMAMMRPQTSAAILARLDPAQAYGISAIIAGRNTGAPTN
ncbi:hypothetical protein BVG79_02080 [Ketogulonicigenium robustum]|uniref:Magnesium transporter MgtE intracellular domain-containing protein n=1 Tax=Ketogulonicigenium robustum TaxID=92947 RepID=A0A1W6P258_9RHOB|nr:flagellar biosynthesis protein FlgI [Ketogulonicigenium robustum]ARO15420.1 hypothetical protein BVG79_02080 [Ketogulonicigenium robustum]